MRRTLIVVFAVLLTLLPQLATELRAQTTCGATPATACPARAGQAIPFAWDASPTAGVTGYRVFVNNGSFGADVPAAGPLTVNIPPQPAGPVTLEVLAFSPFGTSPRAVLHVLAGNPPAPPGNLRIPAIQTASITVTPEGTLVTNVAFYPPGVQVPPSAQ